MPDARSLQISLELGAERALHRDLLKLDALLLAHLRRLRDRGRTTLGETLGGAVIEDGEAEGLLHELSREHSESSPRPANALAGELASPGLRRLQALAGLSGFELHVILLALAGEVDGRYARVFAYLNDHVGMNRPTVGLAQMLVQGGLDTLRSFQPEAPLSSLALLTIDREGPLSSAALALPAELWPRLLGLTPLAAGPFSVHAGGAALDRLSLPVALRAEAQAAADWSARGTRTLVLVSGAEGSGRDALGEAIIAHGGRAALAVPSEELVKPDALPRVRRELLLCDAALLLRLSGSEAAPWEAVARALAAIPERAVVVCPEAACETLIRHAARPSLRLDVPALEVETRAAIMASLMEGQATRQLDTSDLAQRFRMGPGDWRGVLQLAREHAQLRAGEAAVLEPDDLTRAVRAARSVQLGALAQRLTSPYVWEDLVVPATTSAELRLASSFWRNGARVRERLGRAQRLLAGRGLSCLFYGPPGTGKTLGAQILARELGLELYRIDLSQVVNKYIGETEKNLSKVFDAAASTNIVLFFDEADALFGKRTEISNAHDRHANVETAYLLQRIEAHPGLTILATNFRQNMDDAFMRRFQVVAEFPAPSAQERRLIWSRHLPEPELCDPDVDAEMLARQFTLSGGDIRNAVLIAGVLAAEEQTPLGMRHLCLAVYRELVKAGRLVDPGAFGAHRELVFGRRA